MKKLIATIMFVLIFCCQMLSGCGNNEVSSIVLSTNTSEICIGEELTLSYVILPETATDTVIVWKSADDSIATVDNNGKVVGVSAGQTNIIVSANNGVKDVCVVTIKELPPYERMTDSEKEFADVMLKGLQYFKNPKTVSITYAYYRSSTDTWAITVSAQNSMGGYTKKDYDLTRNGNITEPIFNHVKTGLDSHYNLDLINEYLSDYSN